MDSFFPESREECNKMMKYQKMSTELVKNLEHMKSVILVPRSATGMRNKLEYVFLKHQDNTEQNLNLFENLLMRV